MILDDLNLGLCRIIGKRRRNDALWAYYDGDHPLIYSASRLAKIFGRVNARFIENWMGVVIDAASDRINFMGWGNPSDAIAQSLQDLYKRLDIALDAKDAHLDALVTGEAFMLSQVGTDGAPEIYYNDSRLVHVEYQAANPKKKAFAVKLYCEGGVHYAYLYYPDVTFVFESPVSWDKLRASKQPGDVFGAPVDEFPAPVAGQMPVFHFRVSRRKAIGDIDQVVSLQDAINKLVSDMMVGSEFSAFRQRWVISNAEAATIPNAPNQVIMLPAGDGTGQPTAVGEFTEVDLGGYLNAIDQLARSIAIITRTPKHYFYAQGGDPSGEALIAMEAPLVRRVEDHQTKFAVTWQEIGEYLLALKGIAVEPDEILPIWKDPQTVQPRTEAEILSLDKQGGLPLKTTLRRQGWTDAELTQMSSDMAEERQLAEDSEARLAAASMRIIDHGGEA